MQFTPASYLRSAHLQTVLASRIARASQLTSAEFEEAAQTVTLTSRDGVQLQALVNIQEVNVQEANSSAPLVILLHGWLGNATSTYVRRCAAELYQQGFSIARLQLRDHGDTAHLNEALFHSARLTEVLDACNELGQRFSNAGSDSSNTGTPTCTSNRGAIIGFSLGGNFTLRLAGTNQLNPHFKRCIAICPAVNPTTAAVAIDSGWFGYRWYFVRRWQNALSAKAAAFPSLYDFAEARGMSTVAALTDYFVEQHTEFANAAEYYRNYQVSAEMLNNTTHEITILASADDPVIPIADIRSLAQAAPLNYIETPHGGHCGFINNLNGGSPVAAWLAATLQVSES
jgi:predicted alpha/beta-fold hydrolase